MVRHAEASSRKPPLHRPVDGAGKEAQTAAWHGQVLASADNVDSKFSLQFRKSPYGLGKAVVVAVAVDVGYVNPGVPYRAVLRADLALEVLDLDQPGEVPDNELPRSPKPACRGVDKAGYVLGGAQGPFIDKAEVDTEGELRMRLRIRDGHVRSGHPRHDRRASQCSALKATNRPFNSVGIEAEVVRINYKLSTHDDFVLMALKTRTMELTCAEPYPQHAARAHEPRRCDCLPTTFAAKSPVPRRRQEALGT